MERWGWSAGGSKRLLLIPDAEDEGGLKKVVIGDVSPQQEHTITLLKSAQLLLKATDKDNRTIKLGKQAILNAINRLNDKAEQRILQPLRSITVQTASSKEIADEGLFCLL